MSETPHMHKVIREINTDRTGLENQIDALVEAFLEKHGMHACSIDISYGKISAGPGDRILSVCGYGSFVTVRL